MLPVLAILQLPGPKFENLDPPLSQRKIVLVPASYLATVASCAVFVIYHQCKLAHAPILPFYSGFTLQGTHL